MPTPRFRMYRQGQVAQVSWHIDPPTPAETQGARLSFRLCVYAATALAGIAILVWGIRSLG